MKDTEIENGIKAIQSELLELDARKALLQNKLRQLESLRLPSPAKSVAPAAVSPQEDKIALFRSIFRGRDDVFPKRFESVKTGKSGYQPVCRNEWIRPVCRKPQIKCRDCDSRDFVPMSDAVIRNHLMGVDPADRHARDYVIGVYPMLPDETCWFLAIDFDKHTWREDAAAYQDTCRAFDVPAALERSRSGSGGHVWIFFSEPVPAKLARQLGIEHIILVVNRVGDQAEVEKIREKMGGLTGFSRVIFLPFDPEIVNLEPAVTGMLSGRSVFLHEIQTLTGIIAIER